MYKSNSHSHIISAILLLVCTFGVEQKRLFAQTDSFTNPPEFEIVGRNDKRVVIPFTLVNNLIIIEGVVNESVTLKFILDTGLGTTLITTIPRDVELYLSSSRTVTLNGLGEGESVEAFFSDENQLEIGRAKAHDMDILFLKEDIFKLSSFMGTDVHGIIGYDFFADFAVEIDYLRREIYLYDVGHFKKKFKKLPKHRKWHKFPIYLEERKPYLDVNFQHKPDTAYIPLRLLIDSGSSNAFSLYAGTHEGIRMPERKLKTLLGIGLSGNVNGYLGRIKEINLGEFSFDEPVVAYPDSFAIRHAFALGNRNGSLGGEILRRFKVIFNYKDGYLLLRKNKNFRENFDYNISGIEINTPIPNLPVFVVSTVRENSPAEKEGVQKGDIIKYLNGETVVGMNLTEIINYLQKEHGSRIRLEVQRDTVYKKFNIKLENELFVDD